MAALLVATVVVLVCASHAQANGVPFANGDVLAAVGNGQVKNFSPTGTLLDTLDTTTGSKFTTGMCFDGSGNLYVTNFDQGVSTFSAGGNLLNATFGAASSPGPESCTVDSSNNIYFGQADGTQQVLKFDQSGNLLATYSPAIDARGTDWIDLASDQCTLYYTSEGTLVKRFNVCTNTQLPDFASGLPAPCFEVRIRPNGEVMVACATEVVRLSSSGTVLQTYPVAGASQLFAMNLDPDGTSFWTGDLGSAVGAIYHVDIATGNILGQFNSSPNNALGGLLVVGGIVVSQPTINVTPATGTQTVGSPYTVTATITNPGGSITGQTVSFSVAGANTATGNGTTNSAGQATFTYTGTHAGGDAITASFTNSHSTTVSGTAAVTWTGAVADPKLLESGVSQSHTKLTWCDRVATFTDPDTTGTSSNYGFTINWGDGKTSPGTPSGAGSTWTVGGCHTYRKAGTYRVKTTAVDTADSSGNVVTATSTQIVK